MVNKIKKNKTHDKQRKILFIKYLILSLISIVFISILVILSLKINTNSTVTFDQEINLTPTPTSEPPPKRWVLEKNTNGASKTIAEFCDDCGSYSSFLEQWNDWIFYDVPMSEANQENITINGYNLITGESKIIFDFNKYKNDNNDFTRGRIDDVYDLTIIDNTLFFSLGGYLAKGAIFSVDLPPRTEPQWLVNSSNAYISFWENRYWIMGGEGDGCWSRHDYSLLDLKSKKVNHVASMERSCGQGEDYIDIDKRDTMILAGYTDVDYEEEDHFPVYEYILGIPLLTPSAKEGIVAKQNMPTNIRSIKYLENTDQLFLLGDSGEKYLYDFSSKSISKTDIPTPTPVRSKPESSYKSYDRFENKIKELALPSGYSFELK